MTNPIARPTFYEGEILPAADLGATVDYARNQMARHARNSHSWGIVTGLNLTFANNLVTLNAGIAIDGTGREVVVPANISLDATTFLSDVFPQSDLTTLYPVFLNGVDQTAPASSNLTGACGGSQSTSMQETYNITFGSPGSELQVAQQTAPGITDAPAGGTSGAWLILLGFVTWDGTSQFTGVVDFNPGSKVGPQYVGVNASEVVSSSGSLLLATHPPSAPGSNPVMGMELQESASGGQLIFGKLGTNGAIAAPAMTVDASGNLSLTGQLKAAVTPGSMQVQSGIAFDGMTLPLPVGVNLADVTAGNVTVNTYVTTHYENPNPPNYLVPLECRVDLSTLRIHCRVVDLNTNAVSSGWCDYLVIVAVPAS